ncbi:Zinc knuckle [Popillia japonica]|uniref:Zinc knuckle n=1 Tax=Popillia japonica TaxID=7064 RepID=A0AAW1JZR8_POPJA
MFVVKGSQSLKWQRMRERVQQRNERLDNYFHEKVKLCVELNMDVSETKQVVLIGLRSKSLCDAIFPLRLNSVEELLHFLHEYQTIETKRSERVYDNTRNDPRRTLQATSETKIKDKDSSRGAEGPAQVIHNEHRDPKCYNCGQYGYISRNCKNLKRIPICYACKTEGHKRSEVLVYTFCIGPLPGKKKVR